jgi:hypothetical protein
VQEIHFVFIFAPQIITLTILFNQCSNSGKSVGVFKTLFMKTPIQWLDEQIKEKMGLDEHDTNQLKWFIDKALEKEKEQIIDAVDYGLERFGDLGEEYYNKTYNQNK